MEAPSAAEQPSATDLASRSCAWREGPSRCGAWFPSDSAVVLGAFERGAASLRRGSGGHTLLVGPGTLWVQVVLERSEHTADKLLNRHVRPLLRALTKVTSKPVNYFGRDWISLGGRPVGFVGFAHDAASGRAMLEAVIAVEAPFGAGPRASFLGKEPATLHDLGLPTDHARLVHAITSAYALPDQDWLTVDPHVVPEPPWAATREEAIGTIAAGRDSTGKMRLGGELMASSDAVARLEAAIASGAELDRAVDDAFTTNGATIFGVRSLASVRDALAEALAR